MSVELSDLPTCDLLVAGPPCPPFSRMGQRGDPWADPRAKVLLRIMKWVVHLSRSGLRCFILENVVGIQKAIHKRLQKFISQLHGSWHVEWIPATSLCCAHSRNRVYLVGYCMSSPEEGTHLRHKVAGLTPKLPPRFLRDILVDTKGSSMPAGLCRSQRGNYRRWLRVLKPQLKQRSAKGTFACFNVDRDPRLARRIYRVDDVAPCLRATGGKPWVISLGEGAPRISRLLHVAEMCLLQGISPSSLPRRHVTQRQIAKGCGNAMTVPVVGAIMHGLRRAFQQEI